MLSCKDIANSASDHLDRQVDAKLRWQIRLHLMMCSHCRRFMRHLGLTRHITKGILQQDSQSTGGDVTNRTDSQMIYQRVLQRVNGEKR